MPILAPIGQGVLEETRRNRASFDFIVQNNLFKLSGLIAAFGKTISFPIDAIEIKANWVAVSGIPDFTHNRVTVAEVPQLYHVSTANDVQYALVAMHVISKLVPNWTWATFEHRFNPARCDVIGCKDMFGAQTAMRAAEPDRGPGLSGLRQDAGAHRHAGERRYRAGLCELLPRKVRRWTLSIMSALRSGSATPSPKRASSARHPA